MDVRQILAFRLARMGLAERHAGEPGGAAACPLSDFTRDAALLALAARLEDVSRDGFLSDVGEGRLVMAHALRGAIHALEPESFPTFGRALIGRDDEEIAHQLGQQVKRLAKERRFSPRQALEDVAAAVGQALGSGNRLDRTELHAELRKRVHEDYMPWCKGCQSHHVAPMLWRYATVVAGARLDGERRYLLTDPGPEPDPAEAVRRFLRFYAPAKPGDLADWAGISKKHANRLWREVEDELEQVDFGGGTGFALRDDLEELESPPAAEGLRLLPPGDPSLQKPNRQLLAPDQELRKRLFRPVASPGAVLKDGRLAGLWRARAKGKKSEVEVESLKRLPRSALEEEAERVAAVRGSSGLTLRVE